MTVRAGGAGSVIAYNYFDDSMYDTYSGIGDYWIETERTRATTRVRTRFCSKGIGANNIDNDHTWGNSMYVTFFRNRRLRSENAVLSTRRIRWGKGR